MHRDFDIFWYHGKLTRESAEALLQQSDLNDGSFLVRESNTSSGDFVLSVRQNDDISHFQIRRHAEDAFFSIDENIKIHGLDSLIEYYTSSAGLLGDGLALTTPLRGEAPPHNSRRHGRTNLLHRATTQGNYTIVSELLSSGYSHEAKNQDGQTAVHLAAMAGKDEILRELFAYHANGGQIDTAGNTPLHYACQHNYPATVRLLVHEGHANIQARNTQTGCVPLHEAAAAGHVDVVNALLSLNAPARPRDKDRRLPIDLARENGHNSCVEILENYRCPRPRHTSKSMWFHGTLDRAEAESLIKQWCSNPSLNTNYSSASTLSAPLEEDGTFLVRWSDRNMGIVLTLLCEGSFFHYIIRKQGNFLFIDNGPLLDTLEHIIEYYSFIPDGLPCVLRTPVTPKPKPPVPESSTIPRQHRKTVPKIKESPSRSDTTETATNNNNHNTMPSQLTNVVFSNNQTSMNNNKSQSTNDDATGPNNDYISFKALQLISVIGSGEFGSVYKGTYTKSDGIIIPVAIKTLRNEQIDSANRNAFLSEAQVMMKLKHHCIVRFIGLACERHLYMVQELVALGSMLNYIVAFKECVNPRHEFKIWAAQVACGMKYLEQQRFVHRDLAARNILLATQNQAKISDFGLSRALGADHEYYRAMQGGKWPLKWYAPESYNFGTFSNKSDVWSFGITIWEMYSFGEIPYGDIKGSDAIQLIEKGERLKQPEDCPDHIYDLMRRCWEYKAESRPTFNELLNTFSSDNEYMNLRELLPEANLA